MSSTFHHCAPHVVGVFHTSFTVTVVHTSQLSSTRHHYVPPIITVFHASALSSTHHHFFHITSLSSTRQRCLPHITRHQSSTRRSLSPARHHSHPHVTLSSTYNKLPHVISVFHTSLPSSTHHHFLPHASSLPHVITVFGTRHMSSVRVVWNGDRLHVHI